MRHSLVIFFGIVFVVMWWPAVAGCREPAPEIIAACGDGPAPSDDPRDAGIPSPGVVCLATHPAVGVVIANRPWNGVVMVEKDERDERSDHGLLRAYAWREGESRVETFPRFEWETSDPSLVRLAPGEADNEVRVSVRRDRFDEPTEEDPRATVRVCAVNDCEHTCRPCVSRICSAPLTVVGLPNLEGRWQVTADTLPFPALVDVRQDGSRLITGFADVSGLVEGSTVSFELREVHYTGAISPDRDHAAGTIRGGDLGTWSAVRIPPPY